MFFLPCFTVSCRKLFASLGKERLFETTVEASLLQFDKPQPGKPPLADHYSELGENTL
jgi:hypothetical protein